MDFKKILEAYQKKVDKEISAFMSKKEKEGKQISEECGEMARLLKEFAERPGKRIRPVLVVFGYKACGGENEKEILKASIAIELIHAYLLIHDDVMDKSETRRGQPAFHKEYEEIYSKKYGKGKEWNAISASVIAGDIIEAFAAQAIAETEFDSEKKSGFMTKLNEINANTGYGQLLDMELEIKKDASEENVELVHLLKTAKYTIEGPLLLGAILAGANKKQVKELSNYAIPVGKAFQMQDDILGVFGSEEKTGKPVDSDLKEGKKTHLVIKAMENGNKEEQEILLAAIGNPELTKEEFEKTKEIIKKTKALDYTKEKAKTYAQEGMKSLKKSSLNIKGREFLEGMARYILEREL